MYKDLCSIALFDRFIQRLTTDLPVILPRMPPRKPEAEVPRRCEGTVVGRESELCGGLPLTIVRTVTWREPEDEKAYNLRVVFRWILFETKEGKPSDGMRKNGLLATNVTFWDNCADVMTSLMTLIKNEDEKKYCIWYHPKHRKIWTLLNMGDVLKVQESRFVPRKKNI